MKHVIEVFDSKTERLVESVDVPPGWRSELALLMNWKTPEDEVYGYDLSAEQLRVLEEWTGRTFDAESCIVQLVALEN